MLRIVVAERCASCRNYDLCVRRFLFIFAAELFKGIKLTNNYEFEILCFAQEDRAHWYRAFKTAQGKPTPELWNEYALELCEEYLLQAKELIKIEMRSEGDVIKKANVSKSLTFKESIGEGNVESITHRVKVNTVKEQNHRLYSLAKAIENIQRFIRELKAVVNPIDNLRSHIGAQPPTTMLPTVDQWDNSLKAIILYKLYPTETGYSLANQYSSVLNIKPSTLRRLIQRAYPDSMEPLKEIDVDVEEAMNAMRAFLESRDR